MRIAFITPEFVTESNSGWGLANYLNRTSRLLCERGHHVEIFVISDRNETFKHGEVLMHRVQPCDHWLPLRMAWRLAKIAQFTEQAGWFLKWLATAKALSNALAAREREVDFDLVQSSDYQAVGLLIRHKEGRRHLVRSSGAADLIFRLDGRTDAAHRWHIWLERQAIGHADRAYAPSRFIAVHCRTRHGLKMGVVRPPMAMEVQPAPALQDVLPPRYFLHFGQIIARKGSAHLVRALPAVWRACPDFQMVWAGLVSQEVRDLMRILWGEEEPRVVMMGATKKPELYAALQRAQAAVLPTLVDNLPNTVIESLMNGIPVIAFRGASVDELVDSATGELVLMEDTAALADAMIRWWRGPQPVKTGFRWDAPIARAMQPDAAIEALLAFAGLCVANPRPSRRSRTPRRDEGRNGGAFPESPKI